MFFLAWYDLGTFLSHLADGRYGFNSVGSPGIDMYQMYNVAPMVKGGMHYIRVGLVYNPHGLFAGNVKRCATFLRTFFDRCGSEINWSPARHSSFERGGVCNLSVIPCHPGSASTPSFPVQAWLTRRELILLVFIHLKLSLFKWWLQHLTSSMVLRKGCMYQASQGH